MNPIVFIARSWGNTRLHEGQFSILPDEKSPTGWGIFWSRADSNPASRHMGQWDNYGPLAANKHGPYFSKIINKLNGPSYNEGKLFNTNITVIFMDDMHICPFCGSLDVERDFDGNDKRKSQWNALQYMDGHLSFGEIAIVQAIANANKATRPHLYRMCDICRARAKNPFKPTSGNRAWPPVEPPLYESIASKFYNDKDGAAWLETKKICHGRAIARTPAQTIKKAIKRRLRRKHLTIAEHQALSMLLSPSIIKQRLKTA